MGCLIGSTANIVVENFDNECKQFNDAFFNIVFIKVLSFDKKWQIWKT